MVLATEGTELTDNNIVNNQESIVLNSLMRYNKQYD